METKTTMPLAMLRRALSAPLIELEQLHAVAQKAAYPGYPSNYQCTQDEQFIVAHLALAIDHLRHCNTSVGKMLLHALSDADREQAADAAGRN